MNHTRITPVLCHGCVPINLYLQALKFGFHMIFLCREIVVFYFFFSNHLKIIKIILSWHKNRWPASFGLWAVVCHPWLREGSCKDLKTMFEWIYPFIGPWIQAAEHNHIGNQFGGPKAILWFDLSLARLQLQRESSGKNLSSGRDSQSPGRVWPPDHNLTEITLSLLNGSSKTLQQFWLEKVLTHFPGSTGRVSGVIKSPQRNTRQNPLAVGLWHIHSLGSTS